MKLIYDNIDKLSALFQKYKVQKVYVFGSILTPQFNDDSDVDFLITYFPESDPLISGENALDLNIELKDLLGRDVDLVNEMYIKNPYFKKSVEATKFLIYG